MATAIEYGLIAAAISAAIIVAVQGVVPKTKIFEPQPPKFTELGWKASDGRTFPTEVGLNMVRFGDLGGKTYFAFLPCDKPLIKEGKILIKARDIGSNVYFAACP